MKLPMHFSAGQKISRSLLALLFFSLATATVSAQTFRVVHTFTADMGFGSSPPNIEGSVPYAGLVLSGNTLYGTASQGGTSGGGTVFNVNTDGTGTTNLHSFGCCGSGDTPMARLILSGNTLYGTTRFSTVFKVNTDGTGFTNLHNFTVSEGADLYAGLILSGNTLYGTAYTGGGSGNGTVFAVNTDGSGFTNLHSFTAVSGSPSTNSDGTSPHGNLILSGDTLYGTTKYGGTSSVGTVFSLHTDGTGFTNLHSFTGGGDGANPWSSLVLSDNTLYGTAAYGGDFVGGTVFALNTDGTGFKTLFNFTAANPPTTNSGGSHPQAGLFLSGNTLYGSTPVGGSAGYGTVFAVNTDGSGFTTLHNFTLLTGSPLTNVDGVRAYGGVILSGNTLYGTAYRGGIFHNGTVFSISFEPQLTIVRSGSNVVITWPTNVAGFSYAGFTLQSTTNLPSTDWSPVPESPSVVGDQFCVTNSPVGDTLFYRLRGN